MPDFAKNRFDFANETFSVTESFMAMEAPKNPDISGLSRNLMDKLCCLRAFLEGRQSENFRRESVDQVAFDISRMMLTYRENPWVVVDLSDRHNEIIPCPEGVWGEIRRVDPRDDRLHAQEIEKIVSGGNTLILSLHREENYLELCLNPFEKMPIIRELSIYGRSDPLSDEP